jgi:hypothetical protein
LCCLKYEQDFYEATLKKVPKVGKEIMTPDGPGIVTEIAVIREKVKVRIRQNDDTFDIREYPLDQVCRPGEAAEQKKDMDNAAELPEQNDMTDNAEFEEDKPAVQPSRKNSSRPTKQRGKENPRENKEGEQPKEERRRYPRPKGKKQSTEQYFEKNMSGAENGEGQKSDFTAALENAPEKEVMPEEQE